MAKKVPERTCVSCRKTRPKKELIRIVRDKEGSIKVDLSGKIPGRGTYICCCYECLDKAKKTKAIEKALQCKMDDILYNELENIIKTEVGENG